MDGGKNQAFYFKTQQSKNAYQKMTFRIANPSPGMYRIVTTSFFLLGFCQKAYVQGARHPLEPEGAAGDGAQRAGRPPRRVFRREL